MNWIPFAVGCASLAFAASAQADMPFPDPDEGSTANNIGSTAYGIFFFLALFVEVAVACILVRRWFRLARLASVYLFVNLLTWTALSLFVMFLNVQLLGLTLLELVVVLVEAAALVWFSGYTWLSKRASTRLSRTRALGVSAAGNASSLAIGVLVGNAPWQALPILWTVILTGGAVLGVRAIRRRSSESDSV